MPGESQDKRGLHFAASVPAGGSVENTHKMQRDATIEEVQTRFYIGQELDLQLNLYIRDPDDTQSSRKIIPTPGSIDHIAGDDDDYRWDVSEPINKGDKIVVEATNQDANNAYNYVVNMDVDYLYGSSRVLTGFVQAVKTAAQSVKGGIFG